MLSFKQHVFVKSKLYKSSIRRYPLHLQWLLAKQTSSIDTAPCLSLFKHAYSKNLYSQISNIIVLWQKAMPSFLDHLQETFCLPMNLLNVNHPKGFQTWLCFCPSSLSFLSWLFYPFSLFCPSCSSWPCAAACPPHPCHLSPYDKSAKLYTDLIVYGFLKNVATCIFDHLLIISSLTHLLRWQ